MTSFINPNPRPSSLLLRDLLAYLEQDLREWGGCDHSVNICTCHLRCMVDDFGKYVWRETAGQFGWQYLKYDVDTDDPKIKALEDAAFEAERNHDAQH